MKIRVKRKILIEATIQEMAVNDIRGMVGERVYQQVKGVDPHPQFVQLDVGRQGTSRGSMIIHGIRYAMQKIWSRGRIKDISKWMNKRIPLYIHHNVDNSQKGRRKVGETIKGWLEEKKDGLHAMAIAWIPSKCTDVQEMISSKQLDICSIEASFLWSLGKIGKVFVDKIKDLSAVALGSRKGGVVPGFATSGIVAQVQEMASAQEVIAEALQKEGFDPDEFEISVDDDSNDPPRGGNKTKVSAKKNRRKKLDDITLGQVQVFIKNEDVMPTQLYGLEELLNVKGVSEAMENEIEERVDAVKAEKDAKVSDLQDKLEKATADLEKKGTELETLNSDLKAKQDALDKQDEELGPYKKRQRQEKVVDLVKASDKLKDVSKEQADYIASHVTIADDIDLEKAGDAIDAAVDQQLQDMEKYGLEIKGKEQENENEGDGEADDGFNPLIPRPNKS